MREAGPGEAPTLPPSPFSKPQSQPQRPHSQFLDKALAPERVDFPEKDPETPHIRFGGEFLPCGWERRCQILGTGGGGDQQPHPPLLRPRGEALHLLSQGLGAVHLTGSLPVSWVLEAW